MLIAEHRAASKLLDIWNGFLQLCLPTPCA